MSPDERPHDLESVISERDRLADELRALAEVARLWGHEDVADKARAALRTLWEEN